MPSWWSNREMYSSIGANNCSNSVHDCCTFLLASVSSPTKCRNLVTGWPDYIGITDTSSYGARGIIIGENKAVLPTVLCLQWPACITHSVVSDSNLRLKNGWVVGTLDCHGRRVPSVTILTHCTIQQQLPHSPLGPAAGGAALAHCNAIDPSACTTITACTGVTINATTHCWHQQCHD